MTITGTAWPTSTAVKFGTAVWPTIVSNPGHADRGHQPGGHCRHGGRDGGDGGRDVGHSAADQFTYVAAPTVTASVRVGPATGGTTVTITGTTWPAPRRWISAASFGDDRPAIPTRRSWSPVPAGRSGTVDVTVRRRGRHVGHSRRPISSPMYAPCRRRRHQSQRRGRSAAAPR